MFAKPQAHNTDIIRMDMCMCVCRSIISFVGALIQFIPFTQCEKGGSTHKITNDRRNNNNKNCSGTFHYQWYHRLKLFETSTTLLYADNMKSDQMKDLELILMKINRRKRKLEREKKKTHWLQRNNRRWGKQEKGFFFLVRERKSRSKKDWIEEKKRWYYYLGMS